MRQNRRQQRVLNSPPGGRVIDRSSHGVEPTPQRTQQRRLVTAASQALLPVAPRRLSRDPRNRVGRRRIWYGPLGGITGMCIGRCNYVTGNLQSYSAATECTNRV